MKLHADVIKQKSNSDIEIVDEIPADDLGNQFQIINNQSSVHRASNSGVSKLVAQEMQFNCNILQQKFSLRETIQRLCKVDDQVLLQKLEHTAMGVGMTKEQLQKLMGCVVEGKSFYPQVEDDSNSDNEVLPRDMCYENKGKLVVRHSEKEQFYSLADKIITQKTDDFMMKHVQEKCHQKLNVSHVTCPKYKCVTDTSDKLVKGVTTTSPPETDGVTETSGKKLRGLKEKIVPEFDYVPHTSDEVPEGVTEPSPNEIDT